MELCSRIPLHRRRVCTRRRDADIRQNLHWVFIPSPSKPSKLDPWGRIQPKLGPGDFTTQSAQFDLWPKIQPRFGATFPGTLKNLTFGMDFNKSLDRVTLPSGLQSLTLGFGFDQSLDRATFGDGFNQNLDRVTLPSSLQSLTFGYRFKQTLERVTLPCHVHSISGGLVFLSSAWCVEHVFGSCWIKKGSAVVLCIQQSTEYGTLNSKNWRPFLATCQCFTQE